MKKLLIILMVVAITSFLFVGCFDTTPPIDPDEPDDPILPDPTVAPVITSVPDIVGGYINKDAAADGIVVNGTAPTYSEVKVYINGLTAGTGDTTATGFWTVDVANADLIKAVKVDGAKVLYATATEAGKAESASSNVIKFTLDTVAPKISSSKAKAGTAGTAAVAAVYQFVETVDTTNIPGTVLYWPCSDVGDVTDAGLFTETLTPVGSTIPTTPVPGITPQIGESLAAAPAFNPLPSGTINWKIEVIGFSLLDVTVTVYNLTAGTSIDYTFPNVAGTSSTSWIPGTIVTVGLFVPLTDVGCYVLITTTNTPVAAAVDGTPGYIDVTFNEPVTGALAPPDGTGIWTAFGATEDLEPDVDVRSATVARLTETAPTIPNLVAGVAYSVSCNGPTDLAGNSIPDSSPETCTGIVMP